MNLTSFLDGFEEARLAANERKFEQEAKVFHGEGSTAKSLLEDYKEEQRQFEQNQDKKRKAKNEIIKLDNDIKQIDNDIITKETEYLQLLDDERNKIQEIVDLEKQLQDLKSQGKENTQEYTDTQNKINTAKSDKQNIRSRQDTVAFEKSNLEKKRTDTKDVKDRAIDKKTRYEEAARRNLGNIQEIDRKYSNISTNGKGLRQNLRNVSQAKDNLRAANAAAKGGTAAKISQGIKGIKGNPYMLIAEAAISAVEFAIDKMTEYARVNAENQMRMMEATTTVSLNKMSSSLAAWQDSMNGAYESLMNAVSSTQSLITATNANELANLKLQNSWTNWIPIWSNLNKMEETELELRQKIQEMELSNAQKRLGKTQEFAKRIDDYLKKQDNSIHQYQTITGMSSSQTEIFGKRMMSEASTFAEYNKTIEDAIKYQTNYTQESGRAVTMSKSDYEKTMATGRLVGDDNFTQFSAEMNLFNQSISSSAELMYGMYKSANKMGISQQKLTTSVLKNMKLAEKYSFKGGIKGFMELAKWAQNVRFNLDSLSGIIDKAQDGGIEGAITQSAKLQVLGGRFAMGSDPIAMQYEAWNDPEAYAKRIQNMFKGFGRTNQETGETTFNGLEMNIIKEGAKGLGMDATDALNMIREENKKNVVKKQLGKNTQLKGEELDGVINRSFRDKDGVWKVNMIGGGTKAVADINQGDISNIVSDNNDEALTQYAKSSLGVQEEIEKTTKQINQLLGGGTYDNYKSTALANNEKTLNGYTENAQSIMDTIIKNRQDATKELEKQLKGLNTILSDYVNDITTVNKAAETAEAEYKKMLKQLKDVKDEAEQNKKQVKAEQNEYEKLAKEGNYFSRAWYKGRLAEGKELLENGGKRDDFTSKSLSAGWTGIKTFTKSLLGFDDGSVSGVGKPMTVSASKVTPINDGSVSGVGKPMTVSASKVTPINDGSVSGAISDPNDHAIFAKVGGPFDKLFNGVFKQVNALYQGIFGGNNNVVPREPLGNNSEFAASDSIESFRRAISEAKNAASTNSTNVGKETFKVEISGKLTLDSNGNNIDIISELQKNPLMLQALSNMIANSISSKYNGGRPHLDASFRK